MDAQTILEQAQQRTGLTDIGDESILKPLGILVDALNNELITAEIIEAHIIELDQSPWHDALRRGNSWVTE